MSCKMFAFLFQMGSETENVFHMEKWSSAEAKPLAAALLPPGVLDCPLAGAAVTAGSF